MNHTSLPSNSSSSSSSSSASLSSSSLSSSSPPPPPSFADRILAPLGFALLVLLVAVISYSFARRRRRRLAAHSRHGASSLPEEEEEDEDDDDGGGDGDEAGAGLSEAAILSYPKLLYSNAELRRGKPSESCCSICLAEYRDSDVLRLLPGCDHYFHLKCVDPWLKLHSSCPICRKSLISS